MPDTSNEFILELLIAIYNREFSFLNIKLTKETHCYSNLFRSVWTEQWHAVFLIARQ